MNEVNENFTQYQTCTNSSQPSSPDHSVANKIQNDLFRIHNELKDLCTNLDTNS